MKKRILSLFLAAVLVFTLLPANVSAAEHGIWGSNITWTFDGGLLTISGSGEIPWCDPNLENTATNAPWFHLGVTDVVVTEGITTIGAYSFAYIDTLKTVTLPKSVTAIGSWAFEDCTALKTINLPAQLTRISFGAFSGCESLCGPMVIPEQVTEICENTFNGCTALTEVVLPDSITYIGASAFRRSGLTHLRIPEQVSWIDFQALSDCQALTAIEVSSANPYYDSDAQGALYVEGFTELVQVPGMASGTFVIPDTVHYIYDMPFDGCHRLTAVSIPATLSGIGAGVFANCRSLASIDVAEGNPTFYDAKGILYGYLPNYETDGSLCKILIACPPAKQVGSFTVPGDVEQLYYSSFRNNSTLTDITIPAGCGFIGTSALTGCSKLQNIRIAEGHPAYYDVDGVVFNRERTEEGYDSATDTFYPITYPDGSILCIFPAGRTGYYEIPEGVTHLEQSSFSEARIQAVGFPSGFRCLNAWSMNDCADLNWLLFTGDKPEAWDGSLENITATIHYPGDNATWADPVLPDEWLQELPHWFTLSYEPYYAGQMPQWPGDQKPENPFTDVKEGSFCYLPVLWAVENGITSGMGNGTFAPNNHCTRGQVVTFLWRAAGKPEPTVTSHPFTDVKEGAFYYKAMLWAVENGITSGMTSTTFAPDAVCNRGQVVTFLHRAKGKPAPTATSHPFTDVNEKGFYYTAMLWAVENGITSGMSATTFAPNNACTRGQVVTFLYRAYAK